MQRYIRYKKKMQQQGLALITVLIFLQIIALLSLYAVSSATQLQKSLVLSIKQHAIFVAAEEALSLLESDNHLAKFCEMMPISSAELQAKSKTWWQKNACSGQSENYHFYYVIEDLGPAPCAEIDQSSKQNPSQYVIVYKRITLFMIDEQNTSREILQSTVTTLDNAISSCQGTHYFLSLGRQMWRELR